ACELSGWRRPCRIGRSLRTPRRGIFRTPLLRRRTLMASVPPICNFGWKARDFRLPATDGKTYSLADIRGPTGTLLAFICNHCPYVKSVIGRLVRDARDLKAAGVSVAAICCNDADNYPEDSFDNMKDFAVKHGFTFPYLHDEDQKVGRAYDAVCTPDFFG